jgi:transcriptional regulator with XRE-family HTH domain
MLAQKIKRARMLSGKTQEQVSELLGISQSKYSRLETGQREPSLTELRSLAECFGMPFEELVRNTPLVLQVQRTVEHAAEEVGDHTWTKAEVLDLVLRNEDRATRLIEMMDRQLGLLERVVNQRG